METIILMILSFAGYIAAYRLYGRFLSKKIFNLSDSNPTPAVTLEDGEDYVPTKKGVIFGHHYTSIAGTGPIVGPAIGVIWGWVPALIWIFAGSIVMGAVHDMGTLVISLRNQGKSLSDCTGTLINSRVKNIFFVIIFLELLIVISIFCLVIAIIFGLYSGSVLPVWSQIPIAVILGYIVYKKKGNLTLFTAIAVLLMYGTVIAGHWMPFVLPEKTFGIPATGVWAILLLIYAFVASILPVTTLLQPRDYINSWQLIVAMGLIFLGVLGAGITKDMHIVAPAFNPHPDGAPALFPFLFITIACGAISGFHSLVSSGTTSKQLSKESDALPVGYGSMIMEAVLATLVLIAVSAGIGLKFKTHAGVELTGFSAWNEHYSSWMAAKGLPAKLDAFVQGSANMIETLHIPNYVAVIIIGVFIASFAGTTLDTATRLQRYIIAEFFNNVKMKFMSGKYIATFTAVATAGALAFATGANGKGAMKLWPMFGAVNQLLAALGLLVVSIYLKKKGGVKFLLTALPCLFMLAMTLWATTVNEISFIKHGKILLGIVNGITLTLAVWMVIETVIVFIRTGSDA
jgi:carbon starvation protein